MRTLTIIFSLFAFPFCLIAEPQLQKVESDPSLYYYPPTTPEPYPQEKKKKEEQQKEEQKEEGDIAQSRSNEFEYNLYDRQQNRIEQNQRQQQQQYYYQQGGSGNNGNGTGTQFRRAKKPSQQQYFNPRDE